MERRGVAVAFAVACAMLVGCTASSSDDDDVEVLAEVIEREVPPVDQVPGSDDADSAAAAERDAAEGDAEEETQERETAADEVEGEGEDGAAAADADAPAASSDGAPRGSPPAGEASGPPRPSAPSTSAPEPRREPAPEPRPGPAPQPPPPSPHTLGPAEVVSAGVLTSTDGSWVETSSTVHDRDEDPDPLVVDLRASAGDGDTQRLGCVPRLVAPGDRGLLVRGELVVSVVTETGDEVTRRPRVRIPLDVELAAGEELELPASRPLTVRHGEDDARFSCLAVLTTTR